MRRRPHARPRSPRPPRPRSDDRTFERRLAALRTDYLRIAPDPAFVARVGTRVAALTRPMRARKRRRAFGFTATVVMAFLSGYLGAGGERFWGRGGVTPSDRVRASSLGAGGPVAPIDASRASAAKPPSPPSPADRLRALLAPLGTSVAAESAAAEPSTLAAWRRATRDPDPTLRAVARALLRATGSPDGVGPRAPLGAAAVDPDDAGETPAGVEIAAPVGETPR